MMTQIILRLELEPDAYGDKRSKTRAGPVEEAAVETGEAPTARGSCPFWRSSPELSTPD